MNAIIVNPENKSELKFIKTLLDKMNIKTLVVSEEDIEAIGLKYAIDEGRLTKKVHIEEAKKLLK
jgi:hypothetical protein